MRCTIFGKRSNATAEGSCMFTALRLRLFQDSHCIFMTPKSIVSFQAFMDMNFRNGDLQKDAHMILN